MLRRSGFVKVSVLSVLAAAGWACAQLTDSQSQPVAPQPAQPAAAAPASGEQPKIEFKEMEHDFGRISDQGDVKTQFNFKNNGTGKLIFKPEQKATCGCTVGKPRSPKNPDKDQFEFAPGEEGYIEVKFSAHGKKGDVQQRVTIQSNDPANQPEGPVLTIRAKVKPTIAFDPPSIGFGDVMAGQTVKQVIRVNGAKTDFAIPYLSTSKGRYINARIIESKTTEVDGEPVGQTTIELTLNSNGLARGVFNAVGTVRTNDPQYALADFPISASVVGDLNVLPPRLNVGVIETNQPFSKTFRVSSRTKQPFKVVKVEQRGQQLPSPLEITYSPVEGENGAVYQFDVKGAAIASPMPINASIIISTDSQTDPTIEMMLSGAVRAQAGAPGSGPGVYSPTAPIAPTNPK